MNGSADFNSRFSDVNSSNAATGADHGRSSQVNAFIYTHRFRWHLKKLEYHENNFFFL